MHDVHIHFSEEWSGSGDDERDGDLACLPKLTDVTLPDIPSDVLADIAPPVPLRKEGVSCIEPAVPRIIVSSLHRSDALSVVKYALMSTLQVAFPYLTMVNKEISGIADDEHILMIEDIFQTLQGHKPAMGFAEPQIGIGCHIGAWCGVQDVTIFIRAKVRCHLCEVLIHGEGIKQIGRNSGQNCWIDEVGETVKVIDPIIKIFLIILLFLIYSCSKNCPNV